MNPFQLEAVYISKYFVRNIDIFNEISLDISNGEIVGLIGENGSGKSTLLKILAGLISASKGKVEFKINDKIIEQNNLNRHYSYVAPYINLYDEFTPEEHFKITASLRGINYNPELLTYYLKYFKLNKFRHSQIKSFSSGMKQRMKFILALQINPEILFLDEPTSNLDIDGINKVNEIIQNHSRNNGAVIIATNEEREQILCTKTYNIMSYKRKDL